MEEEYIEMLEVLGTIAIKELVKEAFERLFKKKKEQSEENE